MYEKANKKKKQKQFNTEADSTRCTQHNNDNTKLQPKMDLFVGANSFQFFLLSPNPSQHSPQSANLLADLAFFSLFQLNSFIRKSSENR
jgi:hypothetical protein